MFINCCRNGIKLLSFVWSFGPRVWGLLSFWPWSECSTKAAGEIARSYAAGWAYSLLGL